MALLWAAGILWFAYDFAGSLPADPTSNNSASDQSTNEIGQALGN